LCTFKRVQTDLERSEAAIKVRIRRAEVQIELLQKEFASSSRDVAEMMQPGMGAAMTRLYGMSAARLDRLQEYVEELKDQALAPLYALEQKLQADLNTIVKQVSPSIQLLEEARAILEATRLDLEGARTKNLPTDALKKQLMDCENALEHAEAVNSKPIEAALAKLESLELYRIEEQTRIIRHAVLAEKMMHLDVKRVIDEFDFCVQALNADDEVEQLAEEVDAEFVE